MSYKGYTKDDLITNAKNVTSIAALLRSVGLVPAGGNYEHMKMQINKHGIDTSHFTGKASNKGYEFKTFDDLKRSGAIKARLIKERGHRCENCDGTEWLSSPIPLELHHVDGIRQHNERHNLQLLCPNCHSLTDNYRGRKIGK